MDSSEIEKFIHFYPERNGSFNFEIFKKKEFYETKMGPDEHIRRIPGEPLLSQKAASIFFSEHTPYDSCLFFHEPGTGKSCLSSFIVENFKDTIVNKSKRRPALIIVPNENLIRSYMKDVVTQCTNDVYKYGYTDDEIEEMMDEDTVYKLTDRKKESRVRASVKKTYEIVKHQKFLRNLAPEGKDMNKEDIIRTYSNRIIVIDEAHHFRLQSESGKGKAKKKSAQDYASGKTPGVSQELYNILHEFLHTVENCRIILLTGTPIWDKAEEISTLMNLILKKDEQLPTGKKFIKSYFDGSGELTKVGREILSERFNGKVSFLKPLSGYTKREEIGTFVHPLKKIKTYPTAMSAYQREAYHKAEKDKTIQSDPYDEEEGGTEGGALNRMPRDASIFVFPEFDKKGNLIAGSYGRQGYHKHIKLEEQKRAIMKGQKRAMYSVFKFDYVDKRVGEYVKKNLRNISCKFHALINLIKQNPNELVFIYDDFVIGGGGVINLALILREHGFTWVKSSASLDTMKQNRFCVISHEDGTIKNPIEIEKIIEKFNKPENKTGDYCRIIIGSRKISEGVTIKNVRQCHIISPHWNSSSLEQAMGRIFRVGSHNAFVNPEDKYVKIYKYVSLFEGNDLEYMGNKFSTQETIDMKLYILSEKKESFTSQIYRLLKEVSWDCPITYERNVLEQDKDFTKNTDYTEKNYKCYKFPDEYIDKNKSVWKYSLPEDIIDRSTYDLFYNKEGKDKLMDQLKQLFQLKTIYHFDELKRVLKIKPTEVFLLLGVLDHIINSKIKMKNKYGFSYFLYESQNYFFLEESIATISDKYSFIYSNNPYVRDITPIDVLSNLYSYTSDMENIKMICKNPNVENIRKLNHRTSIVLLEYIYELSLLDSAKTEKEKEAIRSVMEVLGKNLFTIDENITIHVMYNTEYMGVGYNAVLKEIVPNGKMRVYDKRVNSWEFSKDVQKEEEYIRKYKSHEKETNVKEWEKYDKGIYGFIREGQFRLKMKPEPGKRDTKGFVCQETTLSTNKLWEIIKRLGILPDPPVIPNYNRRETIESIKANPQMSIFKDDIESKSDNEIKSILKIISMDKKQLCEFLKVKFQEMGMMEYQS